MLASCVSALSPAKGDTFSREDDEELAKRRAHDALISLGCNEDEIDYYCAIFRTVRSLALPEIPRALPRAFPTVCKMAHPRTLVLDLDETLLHAEDEFDKNPTPENTAAYVLRPGLFRFLDSVSKLYELVVFTASTEEHAGPLVKAIESKRKYFSCVLYRSSCVFTNGYYVKDLRILRSVRDLKNVVAVDDSLISFAFNLDNGIAVSPFEGDKDDKELDFLGRYLLELAASASLRATNSVRLRMRAVRRMIEVLIA